MVTPARCHVGHDQCELASNRCRKASAEIRKLTKLSMMNAHWILEATAQELPFVVSEEVVQLCDESLHRWDELDESLRG